MAKKYIITNYGNTRKLPYKVTYYEISKNCFFETKKKAIADAMGEFEFIGVEVVECSNVKTTKSKKSKKKTTKKKTTKSKKKTPRKKLSALTNKKIKHSKYRRRSKS